MSPFFRDQIKYTDARMVFAKPSPLVGSDDVMPIDADSLKAEAYLLFVYFFGQRKDTLKTSVTS